MLPVSARKRAVAGRWRRQAGHGYRKTSDRRHGVLGEEGREVAEAGRRLVREVERGCVAVSNRKKRKKRVCVRFPSQLELVREARAGEERRRSVAGPLHNLDKKILPTI